MDMRKIINLLETVTNDSEIVRKSAERMYQNTNEDDSEVKEALEDDEASFSYDWCLGRCRKKYQEIYTSTEMAIYRAIRANSVDLKRPMGVYWSWSEEYADCYWEGEKESSHEWLLCAQIKSSNVDWVETIYKNASPYFAHECEIRVKNGSKIFLTSYYQRDNKKPVTKVNKLLSVGFNKGA